MIPLGVLASRRASSPAAIEFVGANRAPATIVTIPAHQAGDLLIMFATGNSVPTLPAGWTSIGTDGGSFGIPGGRIAYRVATAPGTTSGTWSGASWLVVGVYRGQHPSTPIGVHAFRTNAGQNVIYYPALTGMQSAGSWVAVAVRHSGYGPHALPSPLVSRASTDTFGVWADSDGEVSAWPLKGPQTAMESAAYLSYSLEIRGGI